MIDNPHMPLRPGYGTAEAQALQGRVVSAEPSTGGAWRHPWSVSAQWSPASRQWAATIKPGFVNADCPIYRTSTQEQQEVDDDFGINPLSGEPYFSSPVFSRGTSGAPGVRTLELPLYLSPAIPLTQWRRLGSDGDFTLPAPQFFLNAGVTEGDAPRPASARLLRACDLVLHQPRVALTVTIQPKLDILTGTSLLQQTLTTRFPAGDDVLRVYSGTFHLPEAPDPLANNYEEQAWDELKIATVYLLSPAGARPQSEPDGTWKAYAQHELFWPLKWIPAPPLVSADLSTTTNPLAGLGGLGAGLLLPIVNTIAAAANDAAQQALNYIQGHSQAGTWWTPTGGGHLSTLPAVPAPLVSTGFDKAAAARARAARATALLQAGLAVQLDPPFPYAGIGFPAERLAA